ncbi:hypothetical protein [Paracoccus ravus]|uniref:hypothetical protein n=1 Tax=Paracoccus ravus TaxID=2447760 RepID=UPI00106EC120|nr:hypothetical protein [Paracoccus ravus]
MSRARPQASGCPLRHLPRFWDVHCHRLALQVETVLHRSMAEGGLHSLSDRIISAEIRASAVWIDRRPHIQKQGMLNSTR